MDYIDVRSQLRRSGEFGINILPNGRINLNKKLTEYLGVNKISLKFRKEGLEVVVFNDNNGFVLPKSGSFKNKEFVDYLIEQKLPLPIHYNIKLDEGKVFKGTLANEMIAKVKKK